MLADGRPLQLDAFALPAPDALILGIRKGSHRFIAT